MTTLQQRIDAEIAVFHERHPEWDVTIVGVDVGLSKRGRGPGTSAYVATADGMHFEVELQPGDDMTSVLGAPMH
jgi:hypothetical protein